MCFWGGAQFLPVTSLLSNRIWALESPAISATSRLCREKRSMDGPALCMILLTCYLIHIPLNYQGGGRAERETLSPIPWWERWEPPIPHGLPNLQNFPLFWASFILAPLKINFSISISLASIHFFTLSILKTFSKLLHNPHNCHFQWRQNIPFRGHIVLCWTLSILWIDCFSTFLSVLLNYIAVTTSLGIGLSYSFGKNSVECYHGVIGYL